MAEENSFLQYGDGLVLHNGLPVKWLTEMGDTYNIILHFSQDWNSYNYTGFAAQQQNVNNDFQYAHSYKILPNQGERGYFGKKTQLSRKYTTSAATHLKSGANSAAMKAADPNSPAETFWFGSGNNIPCTAVVFPYVQNPSADYYVGLNTTAKSAIDFTNHGIAGKSEVVQMYVPDMTSLLWSLNTCNFSAVRNLYGPNVSNASAIFQTYDNEFTGSDTIKVIENIYLPKANYITKLGNISAAKNVTANMTITAKDIFVIENFSGNSITNPSYTSGTLKNVHAALSGDLLSQAAYNVSADGVTGASVKFVNSNVNDISAGQLFSAVNTSGSNVKCTTLSADTCSIENITATSANFSGSNLKFNSVKTLLDKGGTNNITANINGTTSDSVKLYAGTTFSGLINGSATLLLSGCDLTNCSYVQGCYVSARNVTVENIKNVYGRSEMANVSATNISADIGNVYLYNYSLVGSNLTADNMRIAGSASIYTSDIENLTLNHYGEYDTSWFRSCSIGNTYVNTGDCHFTSGSEVDTISGSGWIHLDTNSTAGNVYTSEQTNVSASTVTGIISSGSVVVTSGHVNDINSTGTVNLQTNSTANNITANNITGVSNTTANHITCNYARMTGYFDTLTANVSASAFGTFNSASAKSGFYCSKQARGNTLYTEGRVRGSGFIDSITAHTVDSTVSANHITII